MALIRGVARVTVDNPDADGMVTLQGLGRTWRWQEKDGSPGSRVVPTEQVWLYSVPISEAYRQRDAVAWSSGASYSPGQVVIANTVLSRCITAHTAGEANHPNSGDTAAAYWSRVAPPSEYIPELQGCGPRGYAVKADMVLADWTQGVGTWYLAQYGGTPQAQYLWWPGAGVDEYAQAYSTTYRYQDVALWLWRAGAPDGQVIPAYTLIALPGETTGYTWALYLPLNAQATDIKYPRLLYGPTGTTLDPAQHCVDEWQAPCMISTATQQAREEYLSISNPDGHLLIRYSEAPEGWLYRPTGGVTLPRSGLVVEPHGHAVAFNAAPITYPTESFCTPRVRLTVPAWITQTGCTYYQVAHEPGPEADGNLQAATNYVLTTTDAQRADGAEYWGKPLVKFVSDGYRQPVCYAVAELWPPTFSAARSEPVSLTGTGQTLWAEGHVDDTWRGATCRIGLRVAPADSVWKGNNKVSVDAGWAEGGGTTDPTVTASRQFTGYVTNQQRRKGSEELGFVEVELTCEDGIAARLLGKRFMWQHAAYGGLTTGTEVEYGEDTGREGEFAYYQRIPITAGDLVHHILNRAGVPDALIHSHIVNSTGSLAWHLPRAQRGGDLLWDFAADEEVVSALDKIAQAVYAYFGVDQNGTYGMWSRSVYGGTPDFVLDDDTTTEADFAYEVTSERGYDEFRNYVVAVVGQGANTSSWVAPTYPAATHTVTSDPDFIGEDWWEILLETDASGDYAAMLLAMQRYSELVKRRQVVRWSGPGRAALFPGHFVRVDSSGLDVPVGTVFRIVDKSWRVEQTSGEFTTNFIGVKEADPV